MARYCFLYSLLVLLPCCIALFFLRILAFAGQEAISSRRPVAQLSCHFSSVSMPSSRRKTEQTMSFSPFRFVFSERPVFRTSEFLFQRLLFSETERAARTSKKRSPWTKVHTREKAKKLNHFRGSFQLSKRPETGLTYISMSYKVIKFSLTELHSDAVLFCAFSKDGKFLASASRDKTARIYKIRPGAGEFVPGGDVKQLSGHTGAVNVVQFSPDSALALTGSDDRTIRAWKKENEWECVCTLNQFTAPIKSVIFSPVDPVFASMAGNRTTVWTMKGQKYKPENSVDVRSSEKQLKAIWFLPDGRYIVGVATDKTVNIWDFVEKSFWNTCTDTRSNQHEGAILACCFAGRNFISADADGVTLIWELV